MRGLRRNNLLSSWEKFKADLREIFGGSMFKDKFQELSHIQQSSTVVVYLERFEELLNDVIGQFEISLISFFLRGLKPDIRSEINIARTDSLH